MPNVSVLTADDAWPLDTGIADKVVVLHGLEVSDEPAAVLDECHRVMGPGGRAVLIVPNRVGLWARRETTPFGFGRPYTLPQLEAQLTQHEFLVERHAAVLFQPPSNRAFWLKSGKALEKMGRWVPSYLAAGVLMVEVTKRVQAPSQGGIRRRVKRPLEIIEGIGRPEPAPARSTRLQP
jgi:SAM-dependent methyltransferase